MEHYREDVETNQFLHQQTVCNSTQIKFRPVVRLVGVTWPQSGTSVHQLRFCRGESGAVEKQAGKFFYRQIDWPKFDLDGLGWDRGKPVGFIEVQSGIGFMDWYIENICRDRSIFV